MSLLRGLRLLVLGETWTLPIGVAGVLGAGIALRALAPGAWAYAGGFVLLLGTLGVLAVSLGRER